MGYPAATYDLVLILVKNALKYTLDTKVNYDPDQLCHLATPYFSITVVHVHAGPDKREFIAVNVPRLAAGYICQSLDKDCSLLLEGSHFEDVLMGDSHQEVVFLLHACRMNISQ